MQRIVIRCDCGRVLKAGPEHAGRSVRCKDCGRPIALPTAEAFEQLQNREVSLDDLSTLPPQTKTVSAEGATLQDEDRNKQRSPRGAKPAAPGSKTQPQPSPEGASVPGFTILGELGRGGMGVVYKARHEKLNRTVALKMILAGAHSSKKQQARFLSEAKAVAKLQHPNIVQLFEIGESDGLPWFSLEFVQGGSLEQKLKSGPYDIRSACELIVKLATAMQYAHDMALVHRDLKPANILLTKQGEPKITDFGLAKQLEDEGQTRTGAVMGTPGYMAPEQAAGKTQEIGATADVYSLGVILYELLTGVVPFKGESITSTLLLIQKQEPDSPRRHNRKVSKDIETICLKCLQKQPTDRYATAVELAADLQRSLNLEPILARPISRAGRLIRWACRKPLLATVYLSINFLVFTSYLAWEYARGKSEAEVQADITRQVAERRREETEQVHQKAVRALANEVGEIESKRVIAEAMKIEAELRRTREAFSGYVKRAYSLLPKDPCEALSILHNPTYCPEDQRSFTWHLLNRWADPRVAQISFPTPTCVAFSPDNSALVIGGSGVVAVHECFSGAVRHRVELNPNEAEANSSVRNLKPSSVCISSNNEMVAVGNAQGWFRIWHMRDPEVAVTFPGPYYEIGYSRDSAQWVTFSPDNKTLICSTFQRGGTYADGKVKMYDLDGNLLTDFNGIAGPVLFSGDGFRAATSADAKVDTQTPFSWQFDAPVRADQTTKDNQPNRTWARLWLFDRRGSNREELLMVWTRHDNTLRSMEGLLNVFPLPPSLVFWIDVPTDEMSKPYAEKRVFVVLESDVNGVPDIQVVDAQDKSTVAVMSSPRKNQTNKYWDPSQLNSSGDHLVAAASSDGEFLATSSRSGVEVWHTRSLTRIPTIVKNTYGDSSFTADGKLLYTKKLSVDISQIDPETGVSSIVFGLPFQSEFKISSFSANGRFLAVSDGSSVVQIIDLQQKNVLGTFTKDEFGDYDLLKISDDGKSLIVLSSGHRILWDIERFKKTSLSEIVPSTKSKKKQEETAIHPFEVIDINGRPVAVNLATGEMSEIFDSEFGKQIDNYAFSRGEQAIYVAIKNRREGRYPRVNELAKCDLNGEIMWRVVIPESEPQRCQVAISPDVSTIAYVSEGVLFLGDAATGQEQLLVNERLIVKPVKLAFSPDSLSLACTITQQYGRAILVWDAGKTPLQSP